ncbi:hypothetical protein COS54_00745 [Candidatus Shapirobacteria bacterium CG03_land_8_20_14_0_80_39_12]|uniref:GIY-YIG domain-containing protein n=1 Tax=Candidatus Shapirobacteria bacterium CG03_land_8_20_14_0_80_39_12 TaxID=1974879 RepID=A0A2M7BET2_9BACT|nr:MAG: hypothetical protein COS54_00745 [Candidatus Shapirobacteria bacterium CG03_land_8_20_14_0_80_39_12]
MSWFLYLVQGKDSSLYTGITTDIQRRVKEHNQKKGAKALRGKLPVKLVYQEVFSDKISAAKREIEIKKLRREEKLELIGAVAQW